MKRIAVCVLCCLLLAGCSHKPAQTTVPTSKVPEATAPVVHFVTLYAPNEDATGFIYSSFELSEITADSLCRALIEANVLNDDVVFHSITVENGQVMLDVNAAFGRQLMSYGYAGEYVTVGSVVNTLLGAYGAETIMITMDGEIMESGHVVYDFPLEFYENQGEEPLNDLPPMVMVDGKLYIGTGKESSVTARCGMMDGTIDSQVDPWLWPAENNQSNFGTGFGYQYGTEPETIEILIDGTWWIYAAEKTG